MPPQTDDWFTRNDKPQKPAPAADDWFSRNDTTKTPPAPLRAGSPLPGLLPDPVQASSEQTRASRTPGLRQPTMGFQSNFAPGNELGFIPPSPETSTPEEVNAFSRGLNNPLGVMSTELQRRAGEQYNAGHPVRGYLTDVAANAAEFGAGATNPKNVALAAGTALGGAPATIPYFMYEGGKAVLQGKQPGETDAEYRRRQLYGASAVLGSVAAVPEAVSSLRAVPETLRSTAQRGVGGGPIDTARGAKAVAEETADIARSNANATTKAGESFKAAEAETQEANATKLRQARDEAISAEVAQLEKQTASDFDWEQGTREKVANHLREVADTDKAHADLTKKITEENAANKTAVERRKSLDNELIGDPENTADSGQVGTYAGQLDNFRAKLYQEAQEQFPVSTGEVPGLDVADNISQQSAVARLRSSPQGIPTEVSRIIDDLTPEEGGGVTVDGELHGPGDPIYDDLKAQGKLTPEEAAAGEAPQKATVQYLQQAYSDLGRSYAETVRRLGKANPEAAAIRAAQDVVNGFLEQLHKEAGNLPAYKAARTNYAKLMGRMYESGAVAKIIGKIADSKLQTGNQVGSRAVQGLLKNIDTVKELRAALGGYEGAPTQLLDNILAKMAERDGLPNKFKPQQIPVKKPVPVPDIPLRTTVAGKTVTDIPGGGLRPPPKPGDFQPTLQPPPEPFNKQAFIKGKVQDAASRLGRFSLLDLLGVPAIARHGVGRILEIPTVQDWIAGEPPPSMRGQPGQPGAQGAPSPYEPPPDMGGRRTGTGESPTGTERRAGGVDRRATPRRDLGHQVAREQAIAMPGSVTRGSYLKAEGLKVDPQILEGTELAGELDLIIEDLSKRDAPPFTRAQTKAVQNTLDSYKAGNYGRGVDGATRAADLIRKHLGL